jgi:hypothetical protein
MYGGLFEMAARDTEARCPFLANTVNVGPD